MRTMNAIKRLDTFVRSMPSSLRRLCLNGFLLNAAVVAGYFGAKAWAEFTRRLYLPGS